MSHSPGQQTEQGTRIPRRSELIPVRPRSWRENSAALEVRGFLGFGVGVLSRIRALYPLLNPKATNYKLPTPGRSSTELMKQDTFIRVADLSELKTGGPFAISANQTDIVLLRAGAEWRAFAGRCPHQGALLGEGELDGEVLVCRNHRWRFSIDCGQREGGPERLASCPVAERDGGVFVDLTGLKPSPPARIVPTRRMDDLPGPRPLPLIGNLHQLNPTTGHLTLEEWSRRYGPTYQLRMGLRRAVATADPAMIEYVLRARPEAFRRSATIDSILAEAGVRGVFNAEGDAWRQQRKLATAALAQRHLRQLYPSIRTVAERLKRRWEGEASGREAIDIVDDIKRFMIDVTMLIVFGHDANVVGRVDDAIQRELEVIFPVLNRRTFALFPTWRYFQTRSDRRFTRALVKLRAWLDGLLAETRARLKVEPERAQRPSNFIEAMLAAVDEEGKPFSDDVIWSNLVTMLVGGEDTTGFTIAWAIHELCDSPEWAAELRSEADAVIGAMDVAADVDVANRLARAEAVAYETMRLRPVAPSTALETNADVALGDILLPKGTLVFVLPRPAAVSAENFADPVAFRPARWLGQSSGPHNVSAYLPFGSGSRMCPGRSLAFLEIKTLLSMLYKNFDVERVGPSSNVTERFGFTMSPAGLKVRLRTFASGRCRPGDAVVHPRDVRGHPLLRKLYSAHAKTRKLAGRIMRKLSVIESAISPHRLGTSARRKWSIASANSR
jgi:cytochrome P450/nitrite reductase/ring-hydroxylating ferredoxin subunit